jgi:hypothetical protein
MTVDSSIAEDVLIQSGHFRMSRLELPTRCRLIPALRDRLLKGIHDFQLADGTRENHFCLALEEALNNAFFHGNLELCSDLKEDGSSRFMDLAGERERERPWCDRRIRVTEMVGPFGLWITLQDEGRGFDVQAALDRVQDPEALLASGRGLLMMRAFADEVFFNAAGNEVNLVLYSSNENRELPIGTAECADASGRFVLV